jgi:serine-type D-Ala-D-Ala carboxypeptidase/endopeptidase (penicillin-binding protein 4)
MIAATAKHCSRKLYIYPLSVQFQYKRMTHLKSYGFALQIITFFLIACSPAQRISKTLRKQLNTDSAFTYAHIGVSVYDATGQTSLFQFNSNKYFVPASNIKIPTLYAGMKYLGAKLPGLLVEDKGDSLLIQPTGDPTLLHVDYKQHPVFDYLLSIKKPIAINNSNWKTDALGSGWTWNDYLGYYSAERSAMPVYGNYILWTQQHTVENKGSVKDTSVLVYTQPEINWPTTFSSAKESRFGIYRPRTENVYTITEGREMKAELEIPFVTNGITATLELLKDTLYKEITVSTTIPTPKPQIIYSQPSDSMFKPLMFRSDNFYAEQTLMMVSNQLLGYMDEQKLIDSILQSDFKNMPQKPRWADGSGLSRYNLFTPDDFVWLLLKMKEEFGMERLKTIFATGNSGTLRNFYKEEAGFIYAKTGTLSGVVALSGYLYTSKNKLLVFSFLVNNHNTSSVAVRRAVEKFIKELRKKN